MRSVNEMCLPHKKTVDRNQLISHRLIPNSLAETSVPFLVQSFAEIHGDELEDLSGFANL